MKAKDVIEKLELEPLTIEGGYFNELYRSKENISVNGKMRCLGTSIYYLLDSNSISDWHKVASDEIWYYHAGSPAIQLLIFEDGTWEERVIGPDLMSGQKPQSVIPTGTWQAAVLLEKNEDSWGLFGASVFPGFEYEDFEIGKGSELAKAFPEIADRSSGLGLAT